MKKIIIIITALLVLGGCAASSVSSEAVGEKKTVNSSFYQYWVHSFEEQNGQKTPNIFRPAGSRQFPSSRFRMEFGFNQNGKCNYKFLSPTDRHEMRDCVFTKIDNKVYIYDQAGQLLKHLSFTLLELATKDKMLMAYGVQAAAKKETKKDAKPQ